MQVEILYPFNDKIGPTLWHEVDTINEFWSKKVSTNHSSFS